MMGESYDGWIVRWCCIFNVIASTNLVVFSIYECKTHHSFDVLRRSSITTRRPSSILHSSFRQKMLFVSREYEYLRRECFARFVWRPDILGSKFGLFRFLIFFWGFLVFFFLG